MKQLDEMIYFRIFYRQTIKKYYRIYDSCSYSYPTEELEVSVKEANTKLNVI